MNYKVYFFSELIESGSLPDTLNDVDMCTLGGHVTWLCKMNDDRKWLTCYGVVGYSEYKSSIGFDSKNVAHVLLPTDTARHVACEMMFDRTVSHHCSGPICRNCLLLKMYLTKLKRKHESDGITLHAEH